MKTVYLGLGSNVEPETNLKLAVAELRRRYGEVGLSPVYRCPAVGFEGDDFLNLVARIETDDSPQAINVAIEEIHTAAGRVRGSEKFSARSLDIDLLLYGDLVDKSRAVRVPRADVLDYAFVLLPLADLAPELTHPETGLTMARHWREFDAAGESMTPVELIL